MRATLYTVVLLASLCGAALASRDVSPAGRDLLQSETDCKRSVANCKTCRYQFFRGTSTRAVCTRCDTGYVVKNSGRSCWCAPGYKDNGSGTCVACGTGYYCLGSKLSLADSNVVAKQYVSCGAGFTTTSTVAKSLKECVTQPGYGIDGSLCAKGFYNPGFNNRACTRCPGGLTTLGTGSTSPADCVAPTGYYYVRGKAVACAQGTYKKDDGNADCDECPEGTTTAFGAVGNDDKTDCKYLLPGYGTFSALNGVINATLCPADSYNDKDGGDVLDGTIAANFGPQSDATFPKACTKCALNAKTLPETTGASSPDACLAPPGYAFDTADNGADLCADGFFNLGWNREVCKSCGSGIPTGKTGASSEGECYTPAGYGSEFVNGGLVATICPANTYGRPSNTYGIVEVDCTKCPENTYTIGDGKTLASDCKANPGYGYEDGAVNLCDFGFYSEGGTQSACTPCQPGYNTTTLPRNTTNMEAESSATMGATAASMCVVGAGFKYTNGNNGDGGLSPCPRDTFNKYINKGSCENCPSNRATMILSGATLESDCDACKPGYAGNASLACAFCPSGTWAPGYEYGVSSCRACPNPANWTGAMVSRDATPTPEGCVPVFPTDGPLPSSYTWDYLPGYNGTVEAGVTTQAACQTACNASTTCMYFTFTTYNRSVGATDDVQCELFKATFPPTAANTLVTVSTGSAAGPLLMLEVKAGVYIGYPLQDDVTALAIGTTIGTTTETFASAKTDCEEDATCVGLAASGSGTNTWRRIRGALAEGKQTKAKAYAVSINNYA